MIASVAMSQAIAGALSRSFLISFKDNLLILVMISKNIYEGK